MTACNEDSFLKENPLDFNSKENSYQTEGDFDMAVNDLYDLVRWEFYVKNEYRPHDYLYGTDLVYDGEPGGIERHANMTGAYHPGSVIMREHWNTLYKIIAGANVIISNVDSKDFSDETKTLFKAKAYFFRGLAYRTLVYLFGGVPLVLEEVASPKTDFVRATKAETLAQAIIDVKFAAETLKDITEVKDGEISSSAAYHLLSELYLAAGDNNNAVTAASAVINNPALDLMRDRFGSKASAPGMDSYWDLYRLNNQNRKSGNKEGIWVIQLEVDQPGGGSSSTIAANAAGNYTWERHFAPMVRDVRIIVNGTTYTPFKWPVGDYTGGRGIGWGISTVHYAQTVWQSDFNNDIRNANHNFVRKFPIHAHAPNYAALVEAGITEIDVDNPPAGTTLTVGSTANPNRFLYPYQSKITMLDQRPAGTILNTTTMDLSGTTGATYTDQYMFRLAETYLLRAEAYLGLGDKAKAAADINVVRARAKANPVAAANVDLDYILDERIRELGIEEKRRLTLMRTGTLYDRVTRYNPFYANPTSLGSDGVGMLEKYNLWPIPQTVIEANTGAVLEQNPGYE
jgi:hypothetical protein